LKNGLIVIKASANEPIESDEDHKYIVDVSLNNIISPVGEIYICFPKTAREMAMTTSQQSNILKIQKRFLIRPISS
jgi:hypothetical protein